jgi:D-arginine dehydrogenase
VRMRCGSAVDAVRRIAGGFEVSTRDEVIRTRVLVNAGGAWANTVAAMAGANPLPLSPCRRHLFVSAPLHWVDASWPFVWDVSHDIYFRPEGEGLLLCACDQQETGPCDPPLDAAVAELLAQKIDDYMPALAGVAIKKRWAGLRTLSGDGRFVIGWDPEVAGFFWVAGLGGHGVTTSSAVGSLAADLIITGMRAHAAGPGAPAASFSPSRFRQASGSAS